MAIDEEITLRKLEVFICFMRHGSMSMVAETMGISTVSVHRSLHSLQEGLRCPLFRKEGRLLVPLASAYTFLEFAQRSVAECEEGVRRTRLVAGFEATRLIIGSAYSLTVKTVPQLIYGLKSRRPKLDVDLKLGSTRELLARLKSGEIDAAIVVAPEDELNEDFVSMKLFSDDVFFAVALNSTLAKRPNIDLAEMKDEKFVALSQDFVTVKAMQRLFDSAGYSPHVVMRAPNLFSLANLVAEGMGCALLPGRVGLFTHQVKLLALAAPYALQQTVCLVLPKLREREPNLLALTAECRVLAAGQPSP